MYDRFFCRNLSESDDLYDSNDYDTEYEEEDSFEALCRFESQNTSSISSNSLDSWLKQVEYQLPMRRWKVTKKKKKEFQTWCLMKMVIYPLLPR